jgi:hypothetical protein
MRFRLRTLLIVLTLGPMVLAGAWFGIASLWQNSSWALERELERTEKELALRRAELRMLRAEYAESVAERKRRLAELEAKLDARK